MTTPVTVDHLHPRLAHLTVIDVRSPGEYASGHIPGAHNIPLDQLDRAIPALRTAADGSELAVVCASGARSQSACERLSGAGIPALTLVGGTSAWTDHGHALNRQEGARAVWAMERQVRFTAGLLVLLGLFLDLALPGARWLAAVIGAGLVFAALTDTCAMATVLGRLPHNRARSTAPGLDDTLKALAPSTRE